MSEFLLKLVHKLTKYLFSVIYNVCNDNQAMNVRAGGIRFANKRR